MAVNIDHVTDTISSTTGNVALPAITLTTDLAVTEGGTGASTAASARTNLLPSYTGNATKVLAVNSGETDVEWVTAGGGGSTIVTGTATIDFGAAPGANEASVAVTGQTSILATSKVQAWIMADDTSVDHTASDHRYFPVLASLTCGTPSAGTGFTIYARSTQKLTGEWSVRFLWTN